MASDPFGTAELRRRVLEAWRASPARFRADANVEEDLALTGYRDRVVVELAQNAADAATRAGIVGRLTLRLDGEVLTAANTGTPIDPAGIESISVARASSKLSEIESVGRFGVGFAAVLGVSDEPRIKSRAGAVQWSRARALAAVADLPELAAELASRGDAVPVLRLPFDADPPAIPDPDNHPGTDATDEADTVVVLPLRDAAAVDAVRSQLLTLDPTLLLALTALGEIRISVDGQQRVLRAERSGPTTVLHDGAAVTRWHVETAAGTVPLELLADRPTEERGRPTWQVSWAIPVDETARVVPLPEPVDQVVRAPTAVDDPLSLPAVLIASYPLESTRRRVTPGPLADAITGRAADVLATALRSLPPDPSLLRLVPAGFPTGEIDGWLHAVILERLAAVAWLPLAADAETRQRPPDAVIVPDALVAALCDVLPSVMPAGWDRPELLALGARRPRLADLVEELASVEGKPEWWHAVYDAFDRAVPAGPERDALGALPVPLPDGSVAIGPRGLVLPDPATAIGDLSALGVRLAHSAAAHPLLRSLGAIDGTPRALLEQPTVRAAVEASYDETDPAPIAAAVLALVTAAGIGSEELPWLAELALTDAAGEWRPAGELVLPVGLMARVVAADSALGTVADEWLERASRDALMAVGVLDRPALLRETDALGPDHDLDDEAGWWATLPPDAAIDELLAVRDLEQVRDDALESLLDVLAEPPLRAAVVEPALVTGPAGRRRVPSYTAWWLSSRPVFGGRVPRELRLAGSDPLLAGLYDEVVSILDAEFLRAIGVLESLEDADPDDVLDRLADPERPVGRTQLRGLYRWLATQAPLPPARLRAMRSGELTVVPAREVVVVDAPDLLPLLGSRAYLPVSAELAPALAGALALSLASQAAPFDVVSTGTRVDDAWIHDELLVRDAAGAERRVAWRYADGALHVDRSQLALGLGRGRAWRAGDWAERHRRTEALVTPALGMMRADEDDLDSDGEQ